MDLPSQEGGLSSVYEMVVWEVRDEDPSCSVWFCAYIYIHICTCLLLSLQPFRGGKRATKIRRFYFENHCWSPMLYPLIFHKRHQAWYHSVQPVELMQVFYSRKYLPHAVSYTLCGLPLRELSLVTLSWHLCKMYFRADLSVPLIGSQHIYHHHVWAYLFLFSPLQSWATVVDKWEPSPICHITVFS